MSAKENQRRILGLLWDDPATRPSGTRGPGRGLTREQIVTAAIEVAEAEGLPAVSMRRVAAELGVGTASLYTYLRGKAELEALMLDAVALGDTLPHEWPGDWRAKLEAWAMDDWAAIRRHPWTLRLHGADRLPGPNQLRWLDSMLRVFEDTGLTEPEKLAAVEALDAYSRGLGLLLAEVEAPAGAEPYDVAGRNEGLRELVDFSRYPALLAAIRAGASPYAGDPFPFGLHRLLDGIEALIARRTAERGDRAE
ncbi:TetR/AcrR family transcriptional regulator [Streptomyces harbinensis]|uniref:TetR/AcrR family transcriptional regulator n=1 Tax=Streptomyces harbinensis TaxID=1176198 RepID=UPI0036A36423